MDLKSYLVFRAQTPGRTCHNLDHKFPILMHLGAAQRHTKWDNMPEALFMAEPEHCALCFADLE